MWVGCIYYIRVVNNNLNVDYYIVEVETTELTTIQVFTCVSIFRFLVEQKKIQRNLVRSSHKCLKDMGVVMNLKMSIFYVHFRKDRFCEIHRKTPYPCAMQ